MTRDQRSSWASLDEPELRNSVVRMVEEFNDPERGFRAHVEEEQQLIAAMKGALWSLSGLMAVVLGLIVYLWIDRDAKIIRQGDQIAAAQSQIERMITIIERTQRDIGDNAAKIDRHIDNERRHQNGGSR